MKKLLALFLALALANPALAQLTGGPVSSGGGASATDAGAFTAGSSAFAPSGGFYQTTPTANPLTTGQQGLLQITAQRALFSNLRNAAGAEVGVVAAPLRFDPTGTTPQPVTGTFWQATQPVSGTFWQATQPVSGTFWQTTQPISDAILDAAVTSNRVQVNGLIGATGIVGGAGNVSAGVQRVTIATDQVGYSVNATGVASENHTGEVGQNQTSFSAALTTTAGLYVAGYAVGGLQTITAAARVSGTAGASGTGGVVQNVVATTKGAQTTQVDVVLFNANPTGSTCTDHAAFALVVADFAKVIGVAHLTDWTAGNPVSIGQDPNFRGIGYTLASATSIYACAVTRATPTYGTTTDVAINYVLSRN